ncbi:MAG TPA: UDP-2,3-diacylglucosamine diphosphatase [Candidatus Kapabacteria bacterium]|nr:UDP-2,3-diacylglucosamine diphosphatase [Candidatus Kapabacteria bacterium]
MFFRAADATIDIHELESDIILDYDQAEENLARLRFVDTVVISDIHLGSDVSRSKDTLRMLKSYSFKRLILNGDVFEDLNFKRLRKDDWKFLSYIRKLSNPKRGTEVVWVAGNHDGIAQILTHLLGIPVYDEYLWEFDGEKYLAIHGHQFDTFLNERVIISALACNFYKLFQKIDGNEQKISRWMKRRSKTWLRVSEKIAREAMEYAYSKGAQYVFCGHTHLALEQTDGTVKYYNSGCWTDRPSHYLTVDAGAGVVIREFV